eukprot:scaffold54726_cov31-Tisochrysis_lutea.AAC.2
MPSPASEHGLSPDAAMTAQSIGRPHRCATASARLPNLAFGSHGCPPRREAVRPGAAASSNVEYHCRARKSTRLVPQASDASMGASEPSSSEVTNDETSDTAAVFAQASGVRWETAVICGPVKRAYARLPVVAARAAAPPGRKVSKAAHCSSVDESAQMGASASAKQPSCNSLAKEKLDQSAAPLRQRPMVWIPSALQ